MNNVVFFIIILNMLFLLFYCCSMLLSLSLERCITVSPCPVLSLPSIRRVETTRARRGGGASACGRTGHGDPVLLWFASIPYNYLWIGCGILKLYNSSNNLNNKRNNMNNNRTINEQRCFLYHYIKHVVLVVLLLFNVVVS